MEIARYQISIEINENLADLIRRYNGLCREKFHSDYIIDLKNFFPHITLYAPEFPKKNLSKILEKLNIISKKIGPFEIQIEEILQEGEYIMLKINDNENKLKNLHINIVNEFNELRDGLLREKYKNEEFMSTLSDFERNIILNYGYQFVMENYRPHLTLIKFDDSDLAKKCMDYLKNETKIIDDIIGKKVKINNLSLFKAEKHAQCGERIAYNELKLHN